VPTAVPRATAAPDCDRSELRSDHTPKACGGTGPFAMRLLWSAQPLDRPVPDYSPPIAARPTFKKLRFSMSANTGALAAVIESWCAFSQPGDPLTHILLVTLGAALALVGPGAWSVDARLFGWKRINIRNRKS
jgi:hypothetical protein